VIGENDSGDRYKRCGLLRFLPHRLRPDSWTHFLL
jgi:hypothetical protein